MQPTNTNGEDTESKRKHSLPKVAAKFENFKSVQLKPVIKEPKQPEQAENGMILELKVSLETKNRLQNYTYTYFLSLQKKKNNYLNFLSKFRMIYRFSARATILIIEKYFSKFNKQQAALAKRS